MNLCCPAGHLEDPNCPKNVGAVVFNPLLLFGARSCTRLMTAAKLVRYYDIVNFIITLLNMTWSQTVKNFQVHWKALEDKKKNDNTNVPDITNSLPVIKWTEAF